jgi:serine/threonine protein kinase
MITDDGRAVLADFGITQIRHNVTDKSGYTMTVPAGSLRYQAPEVISSEASPKLTPASDVYSFACLTYEVTLWMLL